MAMTVKSGRWSDPTVWDTGVVPGAGAMAHIKAPHQIIYDREGDVILKDVMSEMGSRLTWDATKETRLRANTIMLSGITEMVDKSLSATPGKPKHEIVFHPIAGKEPGAGMGLGAVFTGPTRVRGYSVKGTLRSHDVAIPAGAQTVSLAGVGGSGWNVGDRLLFVGTNYLLPVTSDPQYNGPKQFWGRFEDRGPEVRLLNEYQFGEDEERTITAISGDTVTLDAPLTYAREGMTGTLKNGTLVRETPAVSNLTRSILWRTATAAEDGHLDPYADHTILQRRAHSMFMRTDDVDARYFATKNMGRTSTDPSLLVNDLPYRAARAGGLLTVDKLRDTDGGTLLENPVNVRGRYAIHLHWCGGPYNGAKPAILIGAVAYSPVGDHPIPGWAITHHGSRALIEDCVISNVRGAGMVAELGNETGHWAFNLVTGCRGDGDKSGWGSRAEYYANHNGSVGIAYEFQSRALLVHGNIAGPSKYAFSWHAQKDNLIKRSPRAIDLRMMDPLHSGTAFPQEYYQDEVLGAINVQIPPMRDNTVFACRYGFSVIHRQGDGRHLDKTPLLMERFHCVNVPFAWEVPQYSNTYYVRDSMFKGPLNMMTGSQAIRIGDVTWDWTFANCLLRDYRRSHPDDGAGLNYEGQLIDILYENVTTTSHESWKTATGLGTHAAKDVMGPWEADPTNPNRWMIRRYESIDSATLPTPYPLEPYGRKLPANQPDGTPYPQVKPGDTPYFVLGDGTNDAASTVPTTVGLTLTAGQGRGQGRVYGIIRDSVGDRRWPDYQSSETFPANLSVKSHRTLSKLTPEQLVQRWGCFDDNGTWKCRTWFLGADRFTHVRFSFHVDWTLTGFEAGFLAAHNLGGPPAAPEWPDKLEAVPTEQRPLTPITKTLRFLSRTRLEVVEGQALSHRLRPNEVMPKLEIAGGADAALFKIEDQRLVWASAAPVLRAEPYAVEIRVTDGWGNTATAAHQVIVVPSSRVSPVIADDFTRAVDENLEANPAYLRLTGSEGNLAIQSNRLSVIAGTSATYDLGSLGTSEQEISINFTGYNTGAMVLFRMVDADNWIGFNRRDDNAALILYMRVAGVSTELARFRNVSTDKVTFRAQGRKLVFTKQAGSNEPLIQLPTTFGAGGLKLLDLDPLTEPGALILPDTAPMGTKVGLRGSNSGTTGLFDNFSAKALES